MKMKLNKYRAGLPRQNKRPAKSEQVCKLSQIDACAGPANTLKKILVPIDFSAESINALRYAVPLAEKLDAFICLVSVVETGSLLNNLKNVPIGFSGDTRVEDAKARLVIMAQKEIGKLIPVIPQVRVGKPYEEIVFAAKKLEADLIIISTHGHTGLKLLAQLGGPLSLLLRETLAIAGSVAMWRPMEIYLYEWWPLRRRGQIFDKMSRMSVEIGIATGLRTFENYGNK